MSPEELAEARRILNDTGVTSRENPKGWLSIEEYLPKWLAKDFEQGYTIVKVKNSDGNTAESYCTDHNMWYYIMKEAGVTHWLSE